MTPGDSIVKGLKAVAAHFGVSVRTAQRWARSPDFPRLPGKRFELLQVLSWRDSKDGKTPSVRARSGDPRQPDLPESMGKNYQEERLKRHKADLAEMEVKQRRGELVERREVEQLFVARIMAVKQGLMNLSRALPPQLIHCQEEREMEIIIIRVVRELLEEFSRPLPAAMQSVMT